MDRKLFLTVVVATLLVSSGVAFAAKLTPAAYQGLRGKGSMSHLYLFEKDENTWDIVEGGAWGKMTYSEDWFIFNGHGLDEDVGYTLIRYTDPWPGSPVCLGTATANEGGNVHMKGLFLEGGSKVWLVLSDDVDCGTSKMTGWHPIEYLFEYALI